MRFEYKTDPDVFQKTFEGKKRAEIRVNDRDSTPVPGDELLLRETEYPSVKMIEDPERYPLLYTGRVLLLTVTDVLHGPRYGVRKGWMMISHTAPFLS